MLGTFEREKQFPKDSCLGRLTPMPKRPIQPEDLKRFRHVSEPRIDPDGSRILFSVKRLAEKNKNEVHLYTLDLFDHSVKQWTFGAGANSGARWSPDGKLIAFQSRRGEQASAQIHLLSTDGGEARALTQLPEGNMSALKWSPDGKWIAFTFRETAAEFTKAAQTEREKDGLSTPPMVVTSLFYRLDGDGFYLQQRYALYVVEVATGQVRPLYRAEKDEVESFDWLPDSSGLVVSEGWWEANYAQEPVDSRITVVRLDTSTHILQGLPVGEKYGLAVSPDGELVAYLGLAGRDDDRGDYNRHLFVAPIKGGEARCLSANDDYCLSVGVNSDTKSDDGTTLTWSPDSRALYVQIGWHGAMQIGYVPLEEGGVRLLTEGHHLVYLGNRDRSGEKFACTYGNAIRLQEIALLDLSEASPAPKVLTDLNASLYDEVHLIEPESHWVESTDGAQVQVWTLTPTTSGTTKHPAVLEIHGGPHMMYGYSFMHEFQLLAAAGYVVVYSNPRGSKGYGEAHTSAIRNSWGVKDWEDIESVTRWMQHHPNIQAGRMGVMGGSYGGYMTNWVVGHTHAFRAAITDRCVSNLVSKAGNSDYVWRPNGYWEGYAYGGWDKIRTLWNQSPIAYFDQVQTPMLVIHSEDDLRCNIEQSEQVFAALQQRGIPSRFVRYPHGTSHGMSRNGPADLRLHRLGEILSWWQKYLRD